ncbi:MAG: hypothetical protein FWD06_04015 [Oscillospiraceae bacterium]|nr:hypothetical protein [Oscillospiraceae bacterium]
MPRVTKIDNKSIANKVFLRRKATEHLNELRVLDLFAGNNVLWHNFDKARYYGVELLPDKGKNLNADARQVVDSLDLSDFNVIDCDSYTIPFEICRKIIEHPKVKSGTTVLYTVITSIFTRLPNACLDELGIRDMYNIAPSMFNLNGATYFYDMLGNLGVKEIYYYENLAGFTKHYGYFVIP